MIPSELRLAIFAALDQADASELGEPECVRGSLYNVAIEQGYPVNEAMERFVDILIEEFCPDYSPAH